MFLNKSKIVLFVLIVLTLTFNSCAFLSNLISREREIAVQKKAAIFTVDLRSPSVPVGQIDAQFDNLFPAPGIRTVNIDVLYFPYEDAVCLQYRLNTFIYHQLWHREGREAFLTALQQYNEDFEGRSLRNRNRQTKHQYGVVEGCYLFWQQSQFSLIRVAEGNMDIELGYYFREGSPFFSTTQMQAHFVSPTFNAEDDLFSAEVPMFFTRAQADALAAFFDQDFLQGLAPDVRRPTQEVIRDISADEY